MKTSLGKNVKIVIMGSVKIRRITKCLSKKWLLQGSSNLNEQTRATERRGTVTPVNFYFANSRFDEFTLLHKMKLYSRSKLLFMSNMHCLICYLFINSKFLHQFL